MMLYLESLLRFFGAALDTLWAGSDPATALALVGLVGLTAFAVLFLTRYYVPAMACADGDAAERFSREPNDIAVLLSQSDPDADGHARPRAPGLPLAAA